MPLALDGASRRRLKILYRAGVCTSNRRRTSDTVFIMESSKQTDVATTQLPPDTTPSFAVDEDEKRSRFGFRERLTGFLSRS
jgi:hypothetical protein